MVTKELSINLGTIGDPQYSPGWYVDAAGNRYYYDGTQWYVYAAGYLYPVTALAAYMNAAPKQVTLAPGERLKISISYQYSGPAITGAVERFVIGVYGALGFTEKVVGTNTKNLPLCTTATLFTSYYTLTLPATGVGSDWDDIYAKISGGSPSVPETMFGYENALVIAGLTPTITNFTITDFVKV